MSVEDVYVQLSETRNMQSEIEEHIEDMAELDKREVFKSASYDQYNVEVYLLFSHWYMRMNQE